VLRVEARPSDPQPDAMTIDPWSHLSPEILELRDKSPT